jgi:hypothetical protein
MTYHFCTYFDRNYLSTGLALYRSLARQRISFVLWALCLDQATHDVLSRASLPNVRLLSIDELENDNKQLLEAKQNRSAIEYYFTCTPFLPLYILRHCPEVEVITYLDADLFFFSSPIPIYQEFGNRSILIVGHQFPPHLRGHEIYGKYNVGLTAFRNDEHGARCLEWWRDRCLEWCYDRVEAARFADQKYLDDWPERFQNVAVLQHGGAGLAPWNVANYRLRLDDGRVRVDSQELISFHFAGLKQLNRWVYDPALADYGVRPRGVLKHSIYAPYIRELQEAARWVSMFTNGAAPPKRSVREGLAGRAMTGRRLLHAARDLPSTARRLFQGQFLWVVGRRIL